MENLYLNITKSNFEKTKEQANKDAISTFGEEETDSYLYETLDFNIEELGFENSKLLVSGSCLKDGKDIGYISVNIPLSIECVTNIVEHYVKRMNKLKTVMEAVKG